MPWQNLMNQNYKINILQGKFSSVFSNPDNPDIKEPYLELPHISIPMTEDHFTIIDDAILQAINKIPVDSSPGPDGIPAVLLKNYSSELCLPKHSTRCGPPPPQKIEKVWVPWKDCLLDRVIVIRSFSTGCAVWYFVLFSNNYQYNPTGYRFRYLIVHPFLEWHGTLFRSFYHPFICRWYLYPQALSTYHVPTTWLNFSVILSCY